VVHHIDTRLVHTGAQGVGATRSPSGRPEQQPDRGPDFADRCRTASVKARPCDVCLVAPD